MRRRFVLWLLAVFFLAVQSYAADLSSFFNDGNYVIYNGTELTIGSIKVGDRFYWGKWSLQGDLSFRLTDYGVINDTDFVDLRKRCFSMGAQEVTREEVESYGFDVTNCETFSKRPNGNGYLYCCEYGNVHKVLGLVLNTDNGTLIVRQIGHVFPRFMAEGSSDTRLVKAENSLGNTFYFLRTVYFDKVEINGRTCWREVFVTVNLSNGEANWFVDSFDTETYEPCRE